MGHGAWGEGSRRHPQADSWSLLQKYYSLTLLNWVLMWQTRGKVAGEGREVLRVLGGRREVCWGLRGGKHGGRKGRGW